MNDKLEKAYDRYKEKFNDNFPTIPLSETREDEEIIEMIDICIKVEKDVYDMGYLQLDEDIIY